MASSVEPMGEKKISTTEDKAHIPSGGEEFVIAADLTLYPNPLRCLNKSRNQQKQNNAAKEANEKEKEVKPEDDSSGDIIAADLTKYGSPLDDAKH